VRAAKRNKLDVEVGDGRQKIPGNHELRWVARARVHGGRYIYLVRGGWRGNEWLIGNGGRGDGFLLPASDSAQVIAETAHDLLLFRCGKARIVEAVKNLLVVAELLGLEAAKPPDYPW
jgi:hypothetical protein